jgi:iron complex transport system substrate-binding protein
MKKIVSILLALAMALVLLASCAPTTKAVTIIDDANRPVYIEGIPERIVSLAPSNTEILFALGLGDKVVGVTDFCDYPPEVEELPKVGAPFPGFNLESIIDLEPDIVFSIAGTIVDELGNLGLTVVVIQPKDINDILRDIEMVGKITGKEKESENLVSDLEERIYTIAEKTANVAEKPLVFYEVDGTDPTKPYTTGSGTFQDSLITLAGGKNIAAEASGWYQMNAEAIIEADPEIIILEDAQYGMTPEAVASRSGWGNITAVKERKIYPISDSDLTCRQSPRIVDGLEEIAQIIHPELFSG